MDVMSSASLLAIVAVLASSGRKIVFRYCLKDGADTMTTLIFYNSFGFLFILPFVPLASYSVLTADIALLLSLNGLIWIIACYFEMLSLKYLDVALGEIPGTLVYVLIFYAGIFLFNEPLTQTKILGSALIIAAVFINMKYDAIGWNKGTLCKFLSVLFVATGFTFDKYLTTMAPVELISLSGFLFPAVCYSLLKPQMITNVSVVTRESNSVILLAPLLGVIAYVCMISAFSIGHLSATYSILRTETLMVFFLGFFFLQERAAARQRLFSSSLCALGAIIVCI